MDAQLLLLGAAVAAPYVGLAEWLARRFRKPLYGVGLVVASLTYVGLAAVGGASEWIGTEIGGALVFAALAVGGTRRYELLLALGWALHVGWDVLLHVGPGTGFVPAWYVPACVGFDLVVAGAILGTSLPPGDRRRKRDREPRLAPARGRKLDHPDVPGKLFDGDE